MAPQAEQLDAFAGENLGQNPRITRARHAAVPPEAWPDTGDAVTVDPPVLTHAQQLAESKAAKAAGMAKVDAAAAQAWTRAMLDIVKAICERMDQFTADDVFERLDAIPAAIRPATRDNRAFGPVMIKAAKRGWCHKADLPAVMSRRKKLHASPIQVWQSLIGPGGGTGG